MDERVALERGRLPELFHEWRERELVVEKGDRVRVTEAGFLLSDALFVSFSDE